VRENRCCCRLSNDENQDRHEIEKENEEKNNEKADLPTAK